jgi:hypothetical protein
MNIILTWNAIRIQTMRMAHILTFNSAFTAYQNILPLAVIYILSGTQLTKFKLLVT